MGLLDRLKRYLGDPGSGAGRGPGGGRPAGAGGAAPRSDDELALDRYRYLLRTAPPDAVEEVHAEAFAKLTPQQRRTVFDELSRGAASGDRPASDDPRVLARSAARSEIRQPGFLERTLGGGAGYGGFRSGPGIGSVIGGSLLGTVAGVVIGSAIADVLLPGIGDLGADLADGPGWGGDGYGAGDGFAGDLGADFGGPGYDSGGYGAGGYDGGDFGGGDFGGGDFGGGGGGGDF